MEVAPILAGQMEYTLERTSKVTGSQSGCEVPHGRHGKGDDSSGKPRNVPTFESIILAPQKQVASGITLDTKWWRPGANQLA